MRHLLAFIFLLTSLQPAMAECLSLQTVKSRIAKSLPSAQIILASGDVAANYMRLFNSFPPPSRLPKPDQLIFVTSARFPKAVIVTVFVNNCRVGAFYAGRKLHRLILGRIIIREKGVKS